jgi:hypothetical protein
MKSFTTFRSAWLGKMGILLGVGLLAASQSKAQTYCASTDLTGGYYYISDVTTTGGTTNITNTGTTFSTNGYGDYTAMFVNALPGNTFTLNCTGGPGPWSSFHWAVYCDWNYDGDFNDPGETVYTDGNYDASITTDITVPPNTALGNVRMRIINSGYTAITPCGDNPDAETEDYTIQVLPEDNLAIKRLVSPVTTPFCSLLSYPVSVAVVNRSSNAINSGNVNWSLNGVLQTPVALSAALINTNDSEIVTLATSMYFGDNTMQDLKVWTSDPNNVMDTYPSDDTISQSIGATLLGVAAHATPHDTVVCSGTTITLNAGEYPKSPIYYWTGGHATQTLNVSQAGSYVVKVQNSDGCYGMDTVTVSVYPDPVVNSIAIIDNLGGSYTFNVIGAQNITSYTWDFGDTTGTTTGAGLPTQILHNYVYPGDYTVTLTLMNNCGEITVTKLIHSKGIVTGIDNVTALQQAINVYPNPARSIVAITNTAQLNIKSVRIYNLMGQKVMENMHVNAAKYQCNISDLAVGFYNVIIDTDAGKATKQLEVIR